MAERQRPEGFDKLPARFKDYVRTLDNEIATLEDRLPVAGQTRCRLVDRLPLARGGSEMHMPDATEVAYLLDPLRPVHGGWVSIRIGLDALGARHGDLMEVRGDDGLMVIPSVSNVVYIGPVRR